MALSSASPFAHMFVSSDLLSLVGRLGGSKGYALGGAEPVLYIPIVHPIHSYGMYPAALQ